MTEEQIQEKLKNFTGWEYQNGLISKTYFKPDMLSAVVLVQKIAIIAESLNVFPELLLKFNKLTISVGAGEITENDFKLIKEVEKAAVELL